MAWINGLCEECRKPRELHLFLGTNLGTGQPVLMCPDGLIVPILAEDRADLAHLIGEHHRLAAGFEQRRLQALGGERKNGRDLTRALIRKYRSRIADLSAGHAERVVRLKSDHGEAVVRLQDKHQDEIKQCAARYARLLTATREEHAEDILKLNLAHQQELEARAAAKPPSADVAKLQADNKTLAQGIVDVNALNKRLTKAKEDLEERVAELEARLPADRDDQHPTPPAPAPEDFPADAACESCGKPAMVRLTVDGKDGGRRTVFVCDKQNHRVSAMKKGGDR